MCQAEKGFAGLKSLALNIDSGKAGGLAKARPSWKLPAIPEKRQIFSRQRAAPVSQLDPQNSSQRKKWIFASLAALLIFVPAFIFFARGEKRISLAGAANEISRKAAPLEIKEPNQEKNMILSLPEIRWCLVFGERLDIWRQNLLTGEDIEKYNAKARDYNKRCGSFRLKPEEMEQAKKDVESFRDEIERRFLAEHGPQSGPLENNQLNPAQIERLKRLLTSFGYNCGEINGLANERLFEAIKKFQKDAGIEPTGVANMAILELLQKVQQDMVDWIKLEKEPAWAKD